MSIQASFRSFHVKFFVCGDTENDVVTTKTVPVIHSGVVAPKDSHLPTYTLHLQYEVIILNAVGEGKKKKERHVSLRLAHANFCDIGGDI